MCWVGLFLYAFMFWPMFSCDTLHVRKTCRTLVLARCYGLGRLALQVSVIVFPSFSNFSVFLSMDKATKLKKARGILESSSAWSKLQMNSPEALEVSLVLSPPSGKTNRLKAIPLGKCLLHHPRLARSFSSNESSTLRTSAGGPWSQSLAGLFPVGSECVLFEFLYVLHQYIVTSH